MPNYTIFSDSSCDIPESLLTKHKIITIPFYITFDQDIYFKENIEISNQKFYDVLTHQKVFPKTSLPSVQDYINYFEPELALGNDILCFCLTQKFSGSFQSATNAKLILEEKYTSANICIIDSIQATAGQGILVLQAIYMKNEGYSIEKIKARIEEIKPTSRIMFTVDSLEYLTKGGRVGKVASLAGTMLNLKPLIQLKEGELIPYSNVRGRKKSLGKVIDMVIEYFKENNYSYDDFDFGFANSTCMEDALFLKEKLEELIGHEVTYPIFQVGVTIGTYTGPGALGITFVRKYNR